VSDIPLSFIEIVDLVRLRLFQCRSAAPSAANS